MAIAKVNIGDVDAFRQSIETQKNVVYENIESFHTACDEIGERLKVEKQKALALGADVQSTTAILSSKIEEQQVKVDALQGELYSLQANEPIPEEELVSEPDEYDEEGNLVSIGSSYYEETSAHASWRSEVSKLEGEIEVEESRLNQMQAIEVRLHSVSNKNEEQQMKLDEVLAKLEECKEEIESQKSSFIGVAEEATEKLNRISNVLQEYLSVSIVYNPSNVASVNAVIPHRIGNYSFSKTLSVHRSTSSIYDTSRPDYANYSVARNTVENMTKYFNNRTVSHGYEHAHFPITSQTVLTQEQLNIRKRYEESGMQSVFYSDLDEKKIKEIVALSLYNCEFKRFQNRKYDNRGNVYGARYVYESSLGTNIGIDRSGVHTDKIRMVIEEDVATDQYIVTVFPCR